MVWFGRHGLVGLVGLLFFQRTDFTGHTESHVHVTRRSLNPSSRHRGERYGDIHHQSGGREKGGREGGKEGEEREGGRAGCCRCRRRHHHHTNTTPPPPPPPPSRPVPVATTQLARPPWGDTPRENRRRGKELLHCMACGDGDVGGAAGRRQGHMGGNGQTGHHHTPPHTTLPPHAPHSPAPTSSSGKFLERPFTFAWQHVFVPTVAAAAAAAAVVVVVAVAAAAAAAADSPAANNHLVPSPPRLLRHSTRFQGPPLKTRVGYTPQKQGYRGEREAPATYSFPSVPAQTEGHLDNPRRRRRRRQHTAAAAREKLPDTVSPRPSSQRLHITHATWPSPSTVTQRP
ncbi:hypothetical protein O3P69_009652 [Scylla paramamosain]|uniref:Uncharacterized protein n=1 Tax=Scylla paramamosain TaxID=85552 RepID=A0AAW0SWI0_SCYPA